MDLNAKLSGKQIIIALIVIFGFGLVMGPTQEVVLSHPLIGIALLAGIALIWWLMLKHRNNQPSA